MSLPSRDLSSSTRTTVQIASRQRHVALVIIRLHPPVISSSLRIGVLFAIFLTNVQELA
jgi:hypothetical protein